jgi:hypothetical protein
MDWFEQLTGFPEGAYDETRARLKVEGGRLVSLVDGRSYGFGELTAPSLAELRDRAGLQARPPEGRLKISIATGDAGALHRRAEFQGALFQVASQFNLLEMVGPQVTPEQGVSRYAADPTQGPACAMAAGAATIFRNYLAPVGASFGQTATRQLDMLADVGEALAGAVGLPAASLWSMQNGYALCADAGLEAIARHLSTLDDAAYDALAGKLRIGLHADVEVTNGTAEPRPVVSQAFCSALPVAYGGPIPVNLWEPFARLVLDATYEATLLAGARNAARGASNIVLLTLVGGGVFGNREEWILDAMRRALRRVQDIALDVRIVSYHEPSAGVQQLAASFAPN